MHELSLMEAMVDALSDHIGAERVSIVRLEIGELAGVAHDALRFSFEVCIDGTRLEHATLEIIPIEARGRCRACGIESRVVSLGSPCACGSFDRILLQGGEIRLKEVEVF